MVLALVIGCGERAVQVDPNQVTPEQQVKSALQAAAETGQTGSEMTLLEELIPQIKAKDAAKGEQLQQDYTELMNANDPAKVKAKAQEMISKL